MKKLNISMLLGDSGGHSTSKSITFAGINFEIQVNKNGYDCKPRKWYNNLYVIISILAIFEIIFYTITGRPLENPIIALMIFIPIFLIDSYVFNDNKKLRMNHGAEHKVINAFLHHDLKNVDKYSRFSDGCGGNIFPMLFILIVLSPIIKFPSTIFIIYSIIYNNLESVRRISFYTYGKFVQKFTTAEPTKEILENAKEGFEKLITAELIKMFDDKKEGEL